MIIIKNTKKSFLSIFIDVERIRHWTVINNKRFTARRLLLMLMGEKATDDFIWEICRRMDIYGLNLLPDPYEDPRFHKLLIANTVAVYKKIKIDNIKYKYLNDAYRKVFRKKPRGHRSHKTQQPTAKKEKKR